MSYESVNKVTNQTRDYLQAQGNDALRKGAHEVKKSGKEWWGYVETHPLQSMLFGVIGYFALKGLFKD